MPVIGTMWVCETCGTEIGFSEQDKVCFISYQCPDHRGTLVYCLSHSEEPLRALGVIVD